MDNDFIRSATAMVADDEDVEGVTARSNGLVDVR